eukprot:6484082-Amphidinium_carterae.1
MQLTLDDKIEAKIRSLTPPATPRSATSSASASSSASANPSRLVFTGWKEACHRSDLLEQVTRILDVATQSDADLSHRLGKYTLSAPKVFGKTVLVDLESTRAADIKESLQKAAEKCDTSIKVKVDRPLAERIRSSSLVTMAKAADALLHQRGDPQ